MARYFVQRKRPRSFDDDDWIEREPVAELIPSVCDHEPTDTGLLDVNGDPIMRAPNPIGFGRDDEW